MGRAARGGGGIECVGAGVRWTMATVTIPRRDWSKHLAAMIEAAQDGDTIMVHSEAMRTLGEIAAKRMRLAIELTFAVEEAAALDQLGQL